MKFFVQWYSLDWVSVNHGETRESIFFESVRGGPEWISIMDDFLTYSSLIVSDGLLVGTWCGLLYLSHQCLDRYRGASMCGVNRCA